MEGRSHTPESLIPTSRDRLVVTPIELCRRISVLLVFVLACNSDESVAPSPSPSQPQAWLRIEVLSPTELKGTVARAVQPTPSIVVLDQANKPVSGVKVNFTLSPQNSPGSIQFDTVVTLREEVSISGDYLLVSRFDPNTFRCCVIWKYKRRNVS